MQILLDGNLVSELSDVQKKVIANDINEDLLESDIGNRLNYILNHKYQQSMKRLRSEWMPKLKSNGVKSVPLDDDEFASLVFSQPN